MANALSYSVFCAYSPTTHIYQVHQSLFHFLTSHFLTSTARATYLAEQVWVVLHLGQGVEDVGEEHHGQALLFLGGGARGVGGGAVVLSAALVVQGQQLREGHDN